MRNWKTLSVFLLLDILLVLVFYLAVALIVDAPPYEARAVSEEDVPAPDFETVEQVVIVVVATRIPPTATRTPTSTSTPTFTPSISPMPSRTPTEEPTKPPYVFQVPIRLPETVHSAATPTRTLRPTATPTRTRARR